MDELVLYDHAGPLRRAGVIARHLLDEGRLPRLVEALDEAMGQKVLEEPLRLRYLVGSPELPSFTHLAVAYAFSVYARGYSYAIGIGKLDGAPLYRHHWIRSPMFRSVMNGADITTVDDEPDQWFPWGTILLDLLNPNDSALARSEKKVEDILFGLRSQAGAVRDAVNSGLFEAAASDPADDRALRVGEEFIVSVLKNAGAPPRYASGTLGERARKWLLSIAHSEAPIWEIPVQLLTANLQPKWVRSIETGLRIRYRRDNFWEVFESRSIRQAVRETR